MRAAAEPAVATLLLRRAARVAVPPREDDGVAPSSDGAARTTVRPVDGGVGRLVVGCGAGRAVELPPSADGCGLLAATGCGGEAGGAGDAAESVGRAA